MPTITEEIIIRSIQKRATSEELLILNNWLKEDKRNISCYFQLEEIWNSKHKLADVYIEKSWEMLAQQINKHPVIKPLPDQIVKKQKISWLGYVAAVFAGVLIASTLWLTLSKKSLNFTEPLIQHIVYNKTGVQSIILPDQSEVWLNENSRLSYPEEFSQKSRQVDLSGKAYFDIRKDTEKPFFVQIGKVMIEVTGTEFFVETTSEEKSSVTLISGKVNLCYQDNNGKSVSTPLVPGQQAHINSFDDTIEIETVDVDYYTAWKDGTYRFTDERLEKIAAMLAQHYDLEIHVASSLKNKRFTGRVRSGESIEDVLKSIKKSYPVNYRIADKKINIRE